MMGSVALSYFLLFIFMRGSFINIDLVNDLELKNDSQIARLEFQRKIRFFYSCSNEKNVFFKKIFVAQIIGYFVTLILFSFFLISFFVDGDTANILVMPAIAIGLIYSLSIVIMKALTERKEKNKKKGKNLPPFRLTEDEKAFIVRFKQKSHPNDFAESVTEEALFLETIDCDVCPSLLREDEINPRTHATVTEGYCRLLENVDQTKFDAYTKQYFKDLETVMRIFEKYYGKAPS